MHSATIECLPTEIIQEIFFYCDRSAALPLASLSISAQLSSQSIYNHILRDALAPPPPKTEPSLDYQITVFSYRWFTFFVFQKYLAILCADDACDCISDTKATESCPHLKWPATFPPKRGNAIDKRRLAHIKCPVPNKLLRAPFTQEKTDLLIFLLEVTKVSVWTGSELLTMLPQAKRDAIRERSYHAVKMFASNRKLGVPPSMELIRFAVIEAGCDRTIVLELLRSSQAWGRMSWNDIELESWIAQKCGESDPNAKWLKERMQEVRLNIWPGTGEGFVNIVQQRKGWRLGRLGLRNELSFARCSN